LLRLLEPAGADTMNPIWFAALVYYVLLAIFVWLLFRGARRQRGGP